MKNLKRAKTLVADREGWKRFIDALRAKENYRNK